jgi:cytochrome c oxidase subunit 2
MTETLLLLTIKTQSIFDAASPQSESIKSISIGFIVAALGMLLLVTGLTIYITVRFRARSNAAEPKQTTGNKKLEILMVSVPLALVTLFFFWSAKTMRAVLPDRQDEKPDVVIIAHQWWWQATYPGTGVTTANEIHLPVGKKILVQLNSADVIHDWWVPALSGKMDMIPGMNNYLWMTINKPGVYDGACSEFCGQQHAWMRIKVVAQLMPDYALWIKAHADSAVKPSGTEALSGASLFMTASCSGCHTIRGTSANGTEGPDMTHFASRRTMLAGMMDNNAGNVYKWLSDPQKVKPGAHMPRFIFKEDSIRALTAYLEQLK